MFDSPSTRDFVFSHSKNLTKVSNGGQRMHGLRLDYPATLSSDYRSLDAYGAKIRMEVGAGFKRNIRYNDDDLGLVMDINFPQNPQKWIRVSSKIARENGLVTSANGDEEARELIRESLSQVDQVATGSNAVPVNEREKQWRTPTTNNLGEPMT